MIPSPIAKVYARALYETAKEKSMVESIRTEFGEFVKLIEASSALNTVLTNYAIPVEKKQAIVSEIAKQGTISKEFAKLLELLVQKNRVRFLGAAFQVFEKLVDDAKGVVRGTVTTVESLSDNERNGLSRAFGKKFGKEVFLEQRLDKSLVGGLIVQVNGLTFDGSLKTTIHMLKEHLERQSV